MTQGNISAPLPPEGFEVIDPPNSLARKAAAFRASNVDNDRLDASLARLIRNYPEAIAEQRVALRDAWDKIRRDEAQPEDYQVFGAIAHDLKGQAASFGYPLIGRIAETLSVIAKADAVGRVRLRQLVEAHLSAIEQILNARIEGDGGALGAAIIESLRMVTTRARDPA